VAIRFPPQTHARTKDSLQSARWDKPAGPGRQRRSAQGLHARTRRLHSLEVIGPRSIAPRTYRDVIALYSKSSARGGYQTCSSLKARLREIADETALGLAIELAGPKPDGLARLVAGMIVLTWRTAYGEAIRVFERGASAKKANAAFVALIDRGFAAVHDMVESSSQRPSVLG
jgi:hypothetical protein